jgi:5'-methylthioadenosine phosphorylase
LSSCAAASQPLRIGVIGGSGFYEIDGFTKVDEVSLSTPFGDPSDSYTISRVEGIDDVEVVFLPRHGRGHVLTPTEVNYRANIFGLKELGCSWTVAVTAVGSLQEDFAPGEMVLVSQFIDRTKHRKDTFFGDGIGA